MHFDVLNQNIVVSCPNLTACLRNSAIFDFLHSGELDSASCTRHHPGVQGSYWSSLQHIGVLRGPMLHMSSTHQMQQIHLNDLTLICPHLGVMGVGVRCSLSGPGPEQAKKTQPVNGSGQFSKKYASGPPPLYIHLRKAHSRAFRIYPTYPPLRDTQRAQIRQQWQRPPKTLSVGTIPTVPERHVCMHVRPHRVWHIALVVCRLCARAWGKGQTFAALRTWDVWVGT